MSQRAFRSVVVVARMVTICAALAMVYLLGEQRGLMEWREDLVRRARRAR